MHFLCVILVYFIRFGRSGFKICTSNLYCILTTKVTIRIFFMLIKQKVVRYAFFFVQTNLFNQFRRKIPEFCHQDAFVEPLRDP